MNCPSRTDESELHPDWNQSPQSLSADLTTRADLNGMVNLRQRGCHDSDNNADSTAEPLPHEEPSSDGKISSVLLVPLEKVNSRMDEVPEKRGGATGLNSPDQRAPTPPLSFTSRLSKRVWTVLVRYAQFVGPGFLIAVAYIDPGNYATDIQAGAETKFALLFIVLMSNLFAIFLQTLCIKLGSVTGLDLAENCREHLPKWLNLVLYGFAEAAIIATDIAEVIGSAIALNLLLHIPLVAGCAITLVDVLLLLLIYNPDGSLTRLRFFEYIIMALVFGVMICFCIQLSYIRDTSAGEVFRGYLPSAAVVRGNGIYLSCGILGATVMPHSLFLGSGVVQPRLRQFDEDLLSSNSTTLLHTMPSSPPRPNSIVAPTEAADRHATELPVYRPSIFAIRSCLRYSIAELTTSLFTFALFVNSAILIVSGAALYNNSAASEADLFGIHDLLSATLAPAAGTIFALALLLSGTSAGVVCTMAGQMVSEGMLVWRTRPWVRRLVTRSISITPSIVIAGSLGREGLSKALTASQVVLSVILPFVSAPLIWFTCRRSIMTVTETKINENGEEVVETADMRNGWLVTALGACIWLVLVVMNVALLVLVGLGEA